MSTSRLTTSWPCTRRRSYATVFGEDAYATIPEKAAAHAFFIAESQPFLDGNKRTAALALTVFLDLNGYELHDIGDTELADVLIDLGAERSVKVSSSVGSAIALARNLDYDEGGHLVGIDIDNAGRKVQLLTHAARQHRRPARRAARH